jgi:hypothetical protein
LLRAMDSSPAQSAGANFLNVNHNTSEYVPRFVLAFRVPRRSGVGNAIRQTRNAKRNTYGRYSST